MSKLIHLSLALVLVVFPLIASTDRLPRRGMKKTLAWVVAFNLFFVFLLRVVIPRLG
jgi:hypothetical protein